MLLKIHFENYIKGDDLNIFSFKCQYRLVSIIEMGRSHTSYREKERSGHRSASGSVCEKHPANILRKVLVGESLGQPSRDLTQVRKSYQEPQARETTGLIQDTRNSQAKPSIHPLEEPQAPEPGQSTKLSRNAGDKIHMTAPGTQKCPSCKRSIHIAISTCSGCSHIFRRKEEKKGKRYGERGKKRCPVCQILSWSASRICKVCKHEFRAKGEPKK